MFRPRIQAPTLANLRAAKSSSTPVAPPSWLSDQWARRLDTLEAHLGALPDPDAPGPPARAGRRPAFTPWIPQGVRGRELDPSSQESATSQLTADQPPCGCPASRGPPGPTAPASWQLERCDPGGTSEGAHDHHSDEPDDSVFERYAAGKDGTGLKMIAITYSRIMVRSGEGPWGRRRRFQDPHEPVTRELPGRRWPDRPGRRVRLASRPSLCDSPPRAGSRRCEHSARLGHPRAHHHHHERRVRARHCLRFPRVDAHRRGHPRRELYETGMALLVLRRHRS
jgi:hypothetical protein